MPKRILDQIELEAKQSTVSENALVKQILTNYVDWFRLTRSSGAIPISKESFQKLIQNLDSSAISEIVENINSVIKNISLVRYGKYELKTAIESLSLYVQISNHQLVQRKKVTTGS